MHADDTRFSTPAVWSVFYHELCGTLWDQEALDHVVYKKNHDAMGAALALRYVYQLEWKGVEAEDGVLATLKAAQQHHGGTFLTPAQVRQMARNFTVHYSDPQVPLDDYLDEECGPVRYHWLNDHGKQKVEEAVRKPSEIWVTNVNTSDDVWVFTPGHTA